MTFDQIAIVTLLLAMFVVFALERFRVELVALVGLAVGYTLGLVALPEVFRGFSSPAVVTVVEVLLIVGALARTDLIERFAQLIVRHAHGERAVLAVLCVIGTIVSVPMNNIGALALMFPVTLSVCARLGIGPARALMPLSFATLLGGLGSLTGTPANLVINDRLVAETGNGLAYFELGLVGGPVAIAGVVLLIAASPRFLRDATPAHGDAGQLGPSAFVVEFAIAAGSRFAGQALADVERSEGWRIHDVTRGGAHVFARRDAIVLAAGDTVIAESQIDTVEALAIRGDIIWQGAGDERLALVVTPESTVLGSRLGWLDALDGRNVLVIGLASRHRRIEGSFGDLQIGLGDVLLLSGTTAELQEAALDTGTLPLALGMGAATQTRAWRGALIFLAGIGATASGYVPPEIAFGAVVLVMALTGPLRLTQGLRNLNWSIVLLLACMIPLGAAVESTGAAGVIADGLMDVLPSTSPLAVTAMVLVLTIMITPFVDNVSTAAVLGPIAAGLAARAGVPVEPLLIAVAVGASLDFLTPFGHHNNAVVMGAGGYRFVEFPRLGLPLLVVCAPVALVMIWAIWL